MDKLDRYISERIKTKLKRLGLEPIPKDSKFIGMDNADKNSDIDCNLVLSGSSLPKTLEDITDISTEGKNLFKAGEIELLVAKSRINEIDVVFHCYFIEGYENACASNTEILLVYKKLKPGVHAKRHVYNYPIFGFHESTQAQSHILCLNEGNLISYPNRAQINGKFALTVFQDQICTQVEKTDFHGIRKRREELIERVKKHAKIEGCDPIKIFKSRSDYWSNEYTEFMKKRLYGAEVKE